MLWLVVFIIKTYIALLCSLYCSLIGCLYYQNIYCPLRSICNVLSWVSAHGSIAMLCCCLVLRPALLSDASIWGLGIWRHVRPARPLSSPAVICRMSRYGGSSKCWCRKRHQRLLVSVILFRHDHSYVWVSKDTFVASHLLVCVAGSSDLLQKGAALRKKLGDDRV